MQACACCFGCHGKLRSEVPDDVGSGDERPILVRSDSFGGIAVEGRVVERTVVSNFRTNLDLGREPVLPAQRRVSIGVRDSGPLSVWVVEVFGAQRKVVQLVRRIVDVKKKGLCIAGAGQRATGYGGVAKLARPAAPRSVRSIERQKLRAER